VLLEILNSFDPEPDGLLREVSRHITDEMLFEIASADYRQDVEKHFIALRQVRDTGTFPEKMYWFPGEVLELMRWSQPDNPEWQPGRTGELGHWMRAFCCVALLRATREPWNHGDSLSADDSLIHLIFSLRALHTDLTQEAVRFMAWLLRESDPEGQKYQDEQVCFYGIGLLWFALHRPPPPPNRDLLYIAQWIVRREEEIRKRWPRRDERWLLGLSAGNAPPSPWERLGIDLCHLDLSGLSEQLKEWVQLIGSNLAA
jgi:hypothetical protein